MEFKYTDQAYVLNCTKINKTSSKERMHDTSTDIRSLVEGKDHSLD